jgi:hypothetical protein
MALSGTLDDFSLVDIIQLVDLGKKTGTIVLRDLQGSDATDGRIFFLEGAVHGAETGALIGEAALYSLFLATDGEFELHEGTELPPRTIQISNAFVILEGSSRREAWTQIAGRVPRDEQLLALVPMPADAPEEITLALDKWRIVTMIDERTSVGDIARRAGIGRQRALHMIVELLAAGLVETRQAAPAR